jgi:putative peptidoglycan lipid II flippase
MLLLFYVLRKRLGQMDGWNMFWAGLKSLVASLFMGLVIWMWSGWLTSLIGVRTLATLIVLITGTAIGAVVFAGIAKLLRMEEFNQTMSLVQRKIRSR